MSKIRIQVGVESYKSGKRLVRLTPVDKTVDVDDLVATVVLSMVGIVDAGDVQRGDGEVDIPLGDVADKLDDFLPGNFEWLPGQENVFVRVKQV